MVTQIREPALVLTRRVITLRTPCLDLPPCASQTLVPMAHIYMHFDFGADETKAQEARHKLDVWKQAFRLDKKLQYKLDRPEEAEDENEHAANGEAEAASDSKGKARTAGKKDSDDAAQDAAAVNVSLLVRLYFSTHEKLSQQRWLDRIPTEEPFKSASPKVIHKGQPGFEAAVKQFADLG
ncbi:MAG: hypothetical protein ABLQ96_08370 [Candidatus Acidiferrum sp.]